jgi:uncharacterized phage protein gp47/JayE
MPFSRPSLSHLVSRIQSDLASQLGLSLPLEKHSIISALTYALAGATHLVYGRINFIANQLFIDTATGEYLDRLGTTLGVARRAKTKAQLILRFEGEVGSQIPKGTLLTSPSGITYSTLESCTLSSEKYGYFAVEAQEAGSQGNPIVNSKLTLATAIAGVTKEVTVISEKLSVGFDEEEDEIFRMRLLKTLRNPGQGGSHQDYVIWAQSIPGVGNVWTSSKPNSLTVEITFLTLDQDYPIPSDDLVQKVKARLIENKPLGVRVLLNTLIPVPIPIIIQGNDAFLRLKPLIESSLKKFFLNQTVPGSRISPLSLSSLISRTTQVSQFTLLSPQFDVEVKAGEIATYGGLKCQATPQ